MNQIIPVTVELSTNADQFAYGLSKYLKQLGLPADSVLVPTKERGKVISTLPEVTSEIPIEIRKSSLYLSKFVAACGAGLFDAALNFVWDETITQLRRKIVEFDIDYFYNSTITDPARRNRLANAEDLVELDDWQLIRGAHITGILSDLGFKHLDYIRDMRNWASAAHPNQNQISGLQLVSWLETCIREVIAKEPSAPAIEAKRLLTNLRTHTLSAADAAPVLSGLKMLNNDVLLSLLRTIFGMFTDAALAVDVRQNIRHVARGIWNLCSNEAKNELGLKYGTFAANADVQRKNLAKEFLTVVDGLSHLPTDSLAVDILEKVMNLQRAHFGFNNFHSEPAHAKALVPYVSKSGAIPDSVRLEYVKTVCLCYIGNGYGVSNGAFSYYNEMLGRFTDLEILEFFRLILDSDFSTRLHLTNCLRGFRKLVEYFKLRTSNQTIQGAISLIEKSTDEQVPHLGKTTELKTMLGIKN